MWFGWTVVTGENNNSDDKYENADEICFFFFSVLFFCSRFLGFLAFQGSSFPLDILLFGLLSIFVVKSVRLFDNIKKKGTGGGGK